MLPGGVTVSALGCPVLYNLWHSSSLTTAREISSLSVTSAISASSTSGKMSSAPGTYPQGPDVAHYTTCPAAPYTQRAHPDPGLWQSALN